MAHQLRLRVIAYGLLKCASAPPRICRDACNPSPLFFAMCFWGVPFVRYFRILDSIAWRSQQRPCHSFLICDLTTATSAFLLTGPRVIGLCTKGVFYSESVQRTTMTLHRKLLTKNNQVLIDIFKKGL